MGNTEVILFGTGILAFIFSFPVFFLFQHLSRRYAWVATPSLRRKHKATTPISGGLAIFATTYLAVGVYAWLRPEWLAQNAKSLLVFGLAQLAIVLIGFADDLHGLKPRLKLFLESLLCRLRDCI